MQSEFVREVGLNEEDTRAAILDICSMSTLSGVCSLLHALPHGQALKFQAYKFVLWSPRDWDVVGERSGQEDLRWIYEPQYCRAWMSDVLRVCNMSIVSQNQLVWIISGLFLVH